ncbi:hypothetical protein J0H58_26340 [bacterium]|nr:hypothetical protein [bacterium]
MNPLAPLVFAAPSAPNFELLRSSGWAIASFTGSYCVAWRGRDEVVFEWRGGEWHRVGGRACGAAA